MFLGNISTTFTRVLQLFLVFDEKGNNRMEAWHDSWADVSAPQMELSLQEVHPEDQEIPAWEHGEEHNMPAY